MKESSKTHAFYWQMSALGVVLAATLSFVLLMPRPAKHAKAKPKPTTAQVAHVERTKADALYKTAKGRQSYEAFVNHWKDSPDKTVQDDVSDAKLHLAYIAAREKGFEKARTTFLNVQQTYKGTGGENPDYGSIPDEAAYQAAVCLVGEHKEEEAKKAFLQFIKDRPLSPLAMASFRRVQRLQKGTVTPDQEKLLQSALSKQQERARFEGSVCGPKVIEYLLANRLLPGANSASLDYKAIAKLCGTTQQGTSIEGMRLGLAKLGIHSFGVQLNRKDFAKASTPAILLERDHYLGVLKIEGDQAVVYDTLHHSQLTIKLPPITDPDFRANLIVFSPPTLNDTP